MKNILEAISTPLNVHGGGAFADANPRQRIWRDASTAGRHAVSTPAGGHGNLRQAAAGHRGADHALRMRHRPGATTIAPGPAVT
ncbi:hypothetical protein ABZ543_16540 [Streptomyces roseifaciens]